MATFAGRWSDTFTGGGRPIPSCAVQVVLRGTSTGVPIYTDRTKAAVVSATGNFTCDAYGNGTFMAEPGDLYDLISGAMRVPVSVPADPAEFVIAPGTYADHRGRRTGIYVPTNWGQYWRAKLLGAPASAPQLAIVGDSIARGYYSSTLTSKGWAGLLRATLQATYGDGGGGFRGVVDTALVNSVISNYPGEAVTVSNDATPGFPWFVQGDAPSDGPGTVTLGTAGNGNFVQFQKVRGSTIRIFCLRDPVGSAATYSIDDATAVAFTTVGTAAVFVAATVTGLSNTDHTVKITMTGTSGAMGLNVCGVEGSNPTGVLVNNYGRPAATANTIAATATYGTGGEWSGGSANPADLVIIAFGVNDSNTSVTAATFLTNIDTYLRRVRGAGPKRGQVDVMFVMEHLGNFAGMSLYRDYMTNVRALAETYGAALVDMWAIGANSYARWTDLGYWSSGTTPPLGSAGSDAVHPSDAGHQAIADVLVPVVSAT